MLPNLTMIVAAYAVVRLLALLSRQWPKVGDHLAARIVMTVLALAAIGLITLCLLDTLNVGLSLGSSVKTPTY